MKLITAADIGETMGAYRRSAVLNAALELGLFWKLAEGSKSEAALAEELGIPPKRCGYWLRLLAQMNLLQQTGDKFGLTAVAREGILDVHSQAAWKLLAVDAWDGYESHRQLGQRLTRVEAETDGATPKPFRIPLYVQAMMADLDRARLFARTLYELHTRLAKLIADALDIEGAQTLLDVGGGSGVVSLELLRRHPGLRSVVVDIPNTCIAGREIADGLPEGDRISYLPANFFTDELPKGFDIVLKCDVGPYADPILTKLTESLNEGGRFVIVDRWQDPGDASDAGRLSYLFAESLEDPDFAMRPPEDVEEGLRRAGLEVAPMVGLGDGRWKLIQGRKPAA